MVMLYCDECSVPGAYADFDPPKDDGSNIFLEAPPISPRIINGDVSTPEANTFFVRAGFDEFYWTPELLCGGALIHSDVFVTAAHCSGGFNYGAILFDPATNDFTREVPVDRQLRHPQWNYDNGMLNFDILVRTFVFTCDNHRCSLHEKANTEIQAIRLTTPIASSDSVKPLAYNTNPGFPSEGQLVKGYGFGRTEEGSIAQELREADFLYITNEECTSRTVFSNVKMGEDVMCTEGTTTSTCTIAYGR